MSKHPRAGQPATQADLVNLPELMAHYYVQEPNPREATEKVQFGTSGHRGSALQKSFNEAHILAIAQAIVAYRREQQITGPLLLGKDTHALSAAAFITALEVFVGNGVTVHVQADLGYTPTPVISHGILRHNRENPEQPADGVVITPSHNPPADGGIKYNPPHGGPAAAQVTKTIEEYANAILSSELAGVAVVSYQEALTSPLCRRQDWVTQYVTALDEVVDMAAIQNADLRLGVDAMGGSGLAYWQAIRDHWGLNLELHNDHADASFSFMHLDKDGQIRMDCSSPDAMASLLALKEQYDLGFGNDPDFDRHGIVTPTGLMNPNHYLATAIDYLCQHRSWSTELAMGKTLVSSAIIDRVVQGNQRSLVEVPVGFKWFAPGLAAGELAFGGEESAGAAFLDRQGRPWSTDKDGLIMCLLAAEMQAVTGVGPAERYAQLEAQYGESFYRRVDTQATPAQMAAFQELVKRPPKLTEFAGESVTAVLTKAPGNGAAFGGLKVVTANGWFAARPSGTEPVYKLYAESLHSIEHLEQILAAATELLEQALSA